MLREGLQGVTRWFLYLLIASIGIGAVLAMGIVVFGNWGWVETRILLTTSVIAVGSILAMACAAATARVSVPALPAFGLGLVMLAGVLLVGGMWAEAASSDYWKWAASMSILAVASAHASLLALARLADSLRRIQPIAYAVTFTFAGVLIFIIVGGNSDDGIIRTLAVIGILDAALTVLVPVAHFLSRGNPRDREPMDPAIIDAELAQLRARIVELEAARADFESL